MAFLVPSTDELEAKEIDSDIKSSSILGQQNSGSDKLFHSLDTKVSFMK